MRMIIFFLFFFLAIHKTRETEVWEEFLAGEEEFRESWKTRNEQDAFLPQASNSDTLDVRTSIN